MSSLFWLALFLIVYPYIFYPLILCLFGRKNNNAKPFSEEPDVTIVCAVHNEEKIIAAKIRNFYQLQYKATIIFGLDGCTDRTEQIIAEGVRDHRVRWRVFPRCGKTNVINKLMADVTSSYVVMTDANSIFRADAVKRLVQCISDDVGVVCGQLVLIDKSKKSGEGIYWRFETILKKLESKFKSVMGANGAIYLFRKNLFQPLPSYAINDDFMLSMKIYEGGYGIVYAPEAIAEEDVSCSDYDEFCRHVRDGAGHLWAIIYLWRLLNPFRGKGFLFFVSHRVLRWLAPILLLSLLLLSIVLSGQPFYKGILAFLVVFYTCCGCVLMMGITWKPLYVPAYFIAVNIALVIGYFKVLLGFQKGRWSPRRSVQ